VEPLLAEVLGENVCIGQFSQSRSIDNNPQLKEFRQKHQ
jgi:hypothetical protein